MRSLLTALALAFLSALANPDGTADEPPTVTIADEHAGDVDDGLQPAVDWELALPEGHPPLGVLPPGHPPVAGWLSLPPGHPDVTMPALPPGHPPIGGCPARGLDVDDDQPTPPFHGASRRSTGIDI